MIRHTNTLGPAFR